MCDTAFSCSPTNCLSEEKIGSSMKLQDRVRAFYLFELSLECLKIGFVSCVRVNLSGFSVTAVHMRNVI